MTAVGHNRQDEMSARSVARKPLPPNDSGRGRSYSQVLRHMVRASTRPGLPGHTGLQEARGLTHNLSLLGRTGRRAASLPPRNESEQNYGRVRRNRGFRPCLIRRCRIYLDLARPSLVQSFRLEPAFRRKIVAFHGENYMIALGDARVHRIKRGLVWFQDLYISGAAPRG